MIAGLLDKALVVLKRDVVTAIRYRNSFILTAIGTSAELAAFYFLSRAVGPSFRPEGMEYFPFVLVGTGFYTFLVTTINSFIVIIQNAQQTGTLEVLMTTATPPATLITLAAMSSLIRHTLQLVVYVGAGLLLAGVSVENIHLTACIGIFGLSMVIAIAAGMFAAAVQLAIQKGSAVLWVFSSVAWLLTGALFPVGALPGNVQKIAGLMPMTHSLNGLRIALLGGGNSSGLTQEILVLALFACAMLPCGIGFFTCMLRRARMEGSLSFY